MHSQWSSFESDIPGDNISNLNPILILSPEVLASVSQWF